jgi:hypothetical protein
LWTLTQALKDILWLLWREQSKQAGMQRQSPVGLILRGDGVLDQAGSCRSRDTFWKQGFRCPHGLDVDGCHLRRWQDME